MKRIRGTLACVLLSTAGCREAPPRREDSASWTVPDRGATAEQDSMRDWFIESSVSSIPGTEEEIIAMLGAPDSVVRIPASSAQDPMAYDTIIEAFYPGLNMSILKLGANETLQTIWVSDTTYITGPITIGADTLTLRRLLGPPMLGGDRPGYVCGRCSILNESVRFDLVDGRVRGMLFTFPGS